MTPLMLAAMLFAAQPKKVPEQKIDFDDDVLEGTTKSPYVDIYLGRNRVIFKGLIKVRENFNDKIVRSVDQM